MRILSYEKQFNRTLYIGIEETYVLSVKNLSDKSMMYSWGEANGSDAEKMKLCVCPQNGTLTAKNTEKMKITVVPMKEVQYLSSLLHKDLISPFIIHSFIQLLQNEHR